VDLREGLVHADVESLGQMLHVGAHLRVQLLAADAADGGILVVHGDVEQVVQLTEDAQLSELGDAGQEDELKVRVERLYRRVEVLHRAAQCGKVLLLVYHVEQGGVVFVYDEGHFLSRLLVDRLHDVGKPYVWLFIFVLFRAKLFLVWQE